MQSVSATKTPSSFNTEEASAYILNLLDRPSIFEKGKYAWEQDDFMGYDDPRNEELHKTIDANLPPISFNKETFCPSKKPVALKVILPFSSACKRLIHRLSLRSRTKKAERKEASDGILSILRKKLSLRSRRHNQKENGRISKRGGNGALTKTVKSLVDSTNRA
ncbi:hypothetical protein SJAG_02792 [Schizosaccharomyces japonicus yFS275]|uniref:Uncharacterized protein n=1 Tax=Schizosaccharomyces japonicus (strain yFS275 / FY16936) TaxID=402676 RepID=B6K168_SCHJY|nr:hypothetical protein SJAG_02792 [Schizosaccharomyces japonicus yFS275]EEB07689.1 hypothetical protein SJAG_02792 [Schizosaccharomyces japonicus yFS275]